ncbi:hypothetical protein OSTOST_12287 [Ostertagia ostertagi]
MEEWIPLERMETTKGDEKKDVLYSWTYSPSGRYAVDFDYKEISQLEDEPETHHFLFRFFVLDILEKTWYPYTVNTGPFKEISQLEDEPETHHFLFRFFVLDILEKTWYPYTVNTGPFKRFYSFYWLSDSTGVLLDFSKREGSVRQNLLHFDHAKKIVSCNIIRHASYLDDKAGG